MNKSIYVVIAMGFASGWLGRGGHKERHRRVHRNTDAVAVSSSSATSGYLTASV